MGPNSKTPDPTLNQIAPEILISLKFQAPFSVRFQCIHTIEPGTTIIFDEKLDGQLPRNWPLCGKITIFC